MTNVQDESFLLLTATLLESLSAAGTGISRCRFFE